MTKNSGSTQILFVRTKFALIISENHQIVLERLPPTFSKKSLRSPQKKVRIKKGDERKRLCKKCYLGENHPFGDIYCWDCDKERGEVK